MVLHELFHYNAHSKQCKNSHTCYTRHLCCTTYVSTGSTAKLSLCITQRGRPRNRWHDEVREDGRIVGGEEWQEKVPYITERNGRSS
jgi:hypothetical protein